MCHCHCAQVHQQTKAQQAVEQRIRRDQVTGILAPFNAYFTAKVFNCLTPGIDWRGETKGEMVKSFSVGRYELGRYSMEDIQRTAMTLLLEDYDYKDVVAA